MKILSLALLLLCLGRSQAKFQSHPKHQHPHSHHHKDKGSQDIEKGEPKAATSSPGTTSIVWKYGMELAERCVAPGTLLTFSWSGSGHNVVEVAGRQELEDCRGFTGQDLVPTSGPHVWQAPSIPGSHYFLCGVGSHCSKGGMKAAVRVSNNCGGTENGLDIENDLSLKNDQYIVKPEASTSTKMTSTTRSRSSATTSIVWAYGMELAERCVAPGTSVTFSWSGGGHNVVEVATRQELTDCTGFSGQDIVPTAGPYVWQAPSIPGSHYFVCGVGSHCSGGDMRASVRVSINCEGTEL